MRRPAVRIKLPFPLLPKHPRKRSKKKKRKNKRKRQRKNAVPWGRGGRPLPFIPTVLLVCYRPWGTVTICPTLVSQREDMPARVARPSSNIRAFGVFHPQGVPCPGSDVSRPCIGPKSGYGVASRFARITSIDLVTWIVPCCRVPRKELVEFA